MGQYGDVAVRATTLLLEGKAQRPERAWSRAASELITSTSSKDKACPRNTFLGLCSLGLVRGVPGGSYTDAPDNPRYAGNAVRALRSRPALAENRAQLWRVSTEGEDLRHNGQMDVVVALWSKGLIT